MIHLQLLLIVIAISFDSFIIGMTFGMKRINVHIIALFTIFSLSASIVYISMTFGALVKKTLPLMLTDLLGSFIFIFLGLILLRTNHKSEQKNNEGFTYVDKFDRDASKHISIQESFLLGIFLALDAFGAGFGAAFFQYDKIFTALLIGCATVCLLFLGMFIGKFSLKSKTVASFAWMPPFILIGVGLYHLFEAFFL